MDENPGGRGAPEATVAGEFAPDRPFTSLFATTRDVLLSPRRFFDALPPDGPLWPPVLYFLIRYLATTLISLVATASLFAVPAIFVAVADPSEARAAASGLSIIFVIFVLLSLAFFVLVAVLFFASVPLQHAFVFLTAGRDQRGLRATLRLSCYAVGAPIALALSLVLAAFGIFLAYRAAQDADLTSRLEGSEVRYPSASLSQDLERRLDGLLG